MLTYCPDAQADVCTEKQELRAEENEQGKVKDDVLLEESKPQEGNTGERSPGKRGQA